MSKKKIILGVVVFLILSALLGGSSDKKTETVAPSPTSVPQVKKYEYEIKRKDVNTRVENYDVLIKEGETEAEAIAMEIKKNCQKPCNIYLYDDLKAQQLYLQYQELTTPAELEQWKKENYVYVADHLVGDVHFETGEYTDYPFHDWYYKELKGIK